ncbi:hypothetical protein DPEC_G00364020 [Dallia pectoralis]|nr:hypothetical protein DPEC_G00364020 [Dallia pectoralis]
MDAFDLTETAKITTGPVSGLKCLAKVPLFVETVDATAFDHAMLHPAENVMELQHSANLKEYLEAFKCNTTRSCCLELWDIECHGNEDCSDKDCEHERGDRCATQVDRCSVSEAAQGYVTQGDTPGCLGILDDEAVEKPKAVIYYE